MRPACIVGWVVGPVHPGPRIHFLALPGSRPSAGGGGGGGGGDVWTPPLG